MKESMLTTIDNPFDPRTQFNQWLDYDKAYGYNTLELLDRLCMTSHSLSITDNNIAIEQAMDEVVKITGGLHKKI